MFILNTKLLKIIFFSLRLQSCLLKPHVLTAIQDTNETKSTESTKKCAFSIFCRLRSHRKRQLLHLWRIRTDIVAGCSHCKQQQQRSPLRHCAAQNVYTHLLHYHYIIVDHGSDPLAPNTTFAALHQQWRVSSCELGLAVPARQDTISLEEFNY